MSEKRYLTAEEAISILPDGDEIHTQVQVGLAFIGADWSRKEIVKKIQKCDCRTIAGPVARSMKHGLCVYDKSAKYQYDLLFIETDTARLDELDPLREAIE